jgi:hypothetical protein
MGPGLRIFGLVASQRPHRPRGLCLACLVLLGAALAAPWSGPALAADCPGDIGCTTCVARLGIPNRPPIIFCAIENQNGGCACFTWEEGGDIHCNNWGSCVYGGWQGGDPPRV